MIAKISKGIEQFQEFFDTNFTQCDQGSVEILLMLAYGHMFDIFTPNQLIQTLGLDISTMGNHTVRAVTHLDVSRAQVEEALDVIREVLSEIAR